MLTPTAAAALSPALSIMQSIVADQARLREAERPDAAFKTPTVAVTPGYDSRATQKLNAFYFGDHQSASEVRTKIFSYLADYVAGQIDAVETEKAGDAAGSDPAPGGRIANSLRGMEADVRAGLRASLADYADGRQSAQATAAKLLMTIDLDALSKDTKITRYLEQMIGFDLGGMSAKDILTAFVDPDGKENDRLRSIISDALAGQDGGKTMQRLEDAAKGLRSVEETKRDIEDVKPYDEVDDETKEEDKADIKIAKAYDTLTETRVLIDAVREETAELALAKEAIEAAKGVTTSANTPPSPTGETDAEADPDNGGDGKSPSAGERWAYGDQDNGPDIRHTGTAALYL